MTSDQTWANEEQAVFALRRLYQRYGYTPYKMSQFEEYDLYVRNKDFLISDRIITFSGEGGKLMALKPDVSLSIVKNAPETPGVVQKVYYSENVYRDYREIMQAGLECVGDLTRYDIAEVVLLAVKSLALLGGRYVLDISHMGLLVAVLERCGFDEEKKEAGNGLPAAEEHPRFEGAVRGKPWRVGVFAGSVRLPGRRGGAGRPAALSDCPVGTAGGGRAGSPAGDSEGQRL